ncbi:acyl-CoA dehydrogenase family protein [Nonomuraea sp. NPDC050478]|uniref:acyl-CoA dehydrogenase family protein n=1 Tax=Nonomuraea sp. NPDC050478 TaxID=3364365 RepID=UPI0037A92EE9
MRPLTDAAGRQADPISDTPERAELRAELRRLIAATSPVAEVLRLDEQERFDDKLHGALRRLGVHAVGGHPDHGGIGDIRDQTAVIEELAAGPTSMAVHMVVQYMITHILGTNGSPEQREEWLDRLHTGAAKVSFALSEPAGGTDIARVMRTTARREGDHWLLSGQKTWISGALGADALVVLARTSPAEGSSVDGVTMFLVPAGSPGLQVRELPTVAVHGLDTCEVFFDDVAVPESAVVGAVGAGFRQVVATLNRERINAAAGAIGAASGALDAAVEYARGRAAFGSTLGSFQAVQHRLVDGALAIESARSLLARAAAVEAAGGRADLLSSMAKIAASEAAVKVTQDGMEILGGAGFSREFPMQRWFRDVRLWVFAPLANDMVRNYLGERLLELPRSF